MYLILTLLFIILKNSQICFKNFALFTRENVQSIFGRFSLLCMKSLNPEKKFLSKCGSEWNNQFLFLSKLIHMTLLFVTLHIFHISLILSFLLPVGHKIQFLVDEPISL